MKKRINGKECSCDYCHKELKKELVLDDNVWEELCKKAGSPYPAKETLLCPECIEALIGRPLRIEDLTVIRRGARIALPINLWYYRRFGMMAEAWPYIMKSLETARNRRLPDGRLFPGRKLQRDAWKEEGLFEKLKGG